MEQIGELTGNYTAINGVNNKNLTEDENRFSTDSGS